MKQGKRSDEAIIVVLGLGITGYSVVEWAIRNDKKVLVVDNRKDPPLQERLKKYYPGVSLLSLEAYQPSLAHTLVVSPGMKPSQTWLQLLLTRVGSVQTDMDLFYQYCNKPIIAVTGSNGKTTAASCINLLLKHAGYCSKLIGNVGTPVLDALSDTAAFDYYVVEISSFQLHWMSAFKAYIGVILNVYPNHLDWHQDLHDYWRCKKRLLECSSYSIIGSQLLQMEVCKTGLGLSEASRVMKSSFEYQEEGYIVKNLDAYLEPAYTAVCAVAEQLQIKKTCVLEVFQSFVPWPYRCMLETCSHIKGIWFNDAKSSNIAAACYALEYLWNTYKKPIIWLAGGVTKGESLEGMLRCAPYIRMAVFFGQDASLFTKVFNSTSVSVTQVHSLTQAICVAVEAKHQDDIVLFSPAAASFDQFKNFEHRGQLFTEKVEEIYAPT